MEEYVSAVLTALTAINNTMVAIDSAMNAAQSAMDNLHHIITEFDASMLDDDIDNDGIAFHPHFDNNTSDD